MKVCLRCGEKIGGVEWFDMKHRWDCWNCKLTWWEQSTLYLKDDWKPMQYVDCADIAVIKDVPWGCLAVFSGEVV